MSFSPAAQTPVGSGQVLQGCANVNLDRNRNMLDHGLRPKASRQQEPRLQAQAVTQGSISLLPYQLNNVKLHYLVVRNESLHSGEGVPGADCTAARTIGSYKSQAGREIILGPSSFGLGSHLQHTTAAVLRQSPTGRTLGLSRLRVRPGMYETDRRLEHVQLSCLAKKKFPLDTCISKLSTSFGSPFRILYVSTGQCLCAFAFK